MLKKVVIRENSAKFSQRLLSKGKAEYRFLAYLTYETKKLQNILKLNC